MKTIETPYDVNDTVYIVLVNQKIDVKIIKAEITLVNTKFGKDKVLLITNDTHKEHPKIQFLCEYTEQDGCTKKAYLSHLQT